jgi:hypothetical protein
MAKEVTASIDVKVVEFMLDLPEDVEITKISLNDDKTVSLGILVEDETLPDIVSLEYAYDAYGTMALVNMK